MRFNLGLGSKAKRFFLCSPTKEKTVNVENPIPEFDPKTNDSGFGYSDFGSKGEIYFDTKAWLDSDCEDDFFSVNGDFTPSRGSTPNYQFTPGSPRLNKSLSLSTPPDAKSEPSPTDGKMKLFDLFKENEQNGESETKPDSDKPSRSSEGSLNLAGTNSVWSSEVTPSRDSNRRKERTGRARPCCIPGFTTPNRSSFNEGRKHNVSPLH